MGLVLKRILKLALPSIATFSSITLTGMITLLIVGRLGPTAIAAVGITNILMYNMWAFFAGIQETINYLVSQHFGEGKLDIAKSRTQIALVVSAVLSLILFAFAFILPLHILQWMGARPSLAHAGSSYIHFRMIAFCFSLIYGVLYSFMRGVGDTKTPMYISLISNALLVALTYLLTYGYLGFPKLGLSGAGISMVITEGLACLLSFYIYFVRYHDKFNTRQWYAMHMSEFLLIIKESVKLSAMELSMSLGMLVFTACITPLGTGAVAANEITLNILSLGFMPANGFGAAATTLVGQGIGANRPFESRRDGVYTLCCGLGFMAVFSVYLLSFAPSVAHWYTSNAQVVRITASLIHLASFIQLFDGGGIILAGALRGIGDTTYLSRMSLILNWVIFVPMTLLFTHVFKWGQTGAWLSLCTLIVLIGLCNGVRFFRLEWTQIRPTGVTIHSA